MASVVKLTAVTLAVALSTGAISALAQEAPADPNRPKASERLICRTFTRIGTLAGRERQCFTKAEWERFAQGARKQTEELQGRLPSAQCVAESAC